MSALHPDRFRQRDELFARYENDDTNNDQDKDALARELVQRTIDDMDFIGLVERMDESLVLLSFMLDVPVTDVLYMDAKVSGNYMQKDGESTCRQIGLKRPLFPSTEQFLQSDRWKEIVKLDRMLYDAVNRTTSGL